LLAVLESDHNLVLLILLLKHFDQVFFTLVGGGAENNAKDIKSFIAVVMINNILSHNYKTKFV
jgi:hypothetical protein